MLAVCMWVMTAGAPRPPPRLARGVNPRRAREAASQVFVDFRGAVNTFSALRALPRGETDIYLDKEAPTEYAQQRNEEGHSVSSTITYEELSNEKKRNIR